MRKENIEKFFELLEELEPIANKLAERDRPTPNFGSRGYGVDHIVFEAGGFKAHYARYMGGGDYVYETKYFSPTQLNKFIEENQNG